MKGDLAKMMAAQMRMALSYVFTEQDGHFVDADGKRMSRTDVVAAFEEAVKVVRGRVINLRRM